jgi:hypothetical protein
MKKSHIHLKSPGRIWHRFQKRGTVFFFSKASLTRQSFIKTLTCNNNYKLLNSVTKHRFRLKDLMFTCQLLKNLVTKSGRLVTVHRQNILKSESHDCKNYEYFN